MKQALVIFLILFSFLTAASAELACLCFEDSISHQSGNDQSVEKVEHHDHANASSSDDHQDHCHHTCSQCHFAALVPGHFFSESYSFITRTVFISTQEFPRAISQSLYRPPIA